MNKGVRLLLTSGHGQYLPRDFIAETDLNEWDHITIESVHICQHPNHPEYWEAWNDILIRAEQTDKDGNVWRLWHDEDLFAVCEDLMTDEEFLSFFGEAR